MKNKFFPKRPNVNPTIYAYMDSNPQYDGLLKVGFTTIDVEARVSHQYPVLRPGEKPYKILLSELAIRNDGTSFTDHDVHKYLKRKGIENPKGEWFKCSVDDVKNAIIGIKERKYVEDDRSLSFSLRPEQKAAIEKTINYIKGFRKENPNTTTRFLWNAKMRFGKTFAAYHLAKEMNWEKVLVLTFKPAVQSAWESDLKRHIDFQGWQFVSRDNISDFKLDKTKPVVCFGSFQDYLGKNEAGGIKPKNEWVHATHWDCVILDEYHYGAWRENAQDLFDSEEKKEREFLDGEGREYYDEDIMPITTNHYLYLSGTPFRALSSGDFIEEQIFNWTYTDEQKAKETWEGDNNPYKSLPRMVMLTYRLPDSIQKIALQGEFNEFDLNIFFSAEGRDEKATFKYQEEVQKWLNFLRGAFSENETSVLKLGGKKPPLPYSDIRLLNLLNHTLWFLPSVASCYAMRNLLRERNNLFYQDYDIVVAAGHKAGIGVNALPPVLKAMKDPLKSKTITLTCGKLTTGVTIPPWGGIFMLRNTSSPETYFQAAFRVQSPWTLKNPDGNDPNKEVVLKKECYVFDFSPNRALRLIADYSCRLNVEETNPEKKVAEFIQFLPILAYDGTAMKEIDPAGVLDMVTSGTTATLLAKRWESALLVNVDNDTLNRLMNSKRAMDALMNIEGFRNLNKDIETIINKSEAIKKVKREANERSLTKDEKKELSQEEKDYRNMRKKIQDKLIKFATRIPVFMYLTDYRERTLKDVITQLEPGLFKKVTGLDVSDFELLVSLGVFNHSLMNDAVYKFKRYEDSSLRYIGINKHEGEDVGLYDTVITNKEFDETIEGVEI